LVVLGIDQKREEGGFSGRRTCLRRCLIVASTVVRMKNGEWLRRAGPFEVSEGASGAIEGQVEHWREAALAEREEVNELTELLDESDELFAQLHGLLIEERSKHDL
jgi:hypothetical protein